MANKEIEMFYISEISKVVPEKFSSELQEKVSFWKGGNGRSSLNGRLCSCSALGISRVSFAPKELFDEILRAKTGAATVFSTLTDWEKNIQVIFDQDVVKNEYYGCSDGTTTGYMKVKTKDILDTLLPYSKHRYKVIRWRED